MSELPPIGNFQRIKEKAIVISLYGHKCKIISLDDLIVIKQTMTRPKDKQTLQELKLLQKVEKD